jgi:hypothetical protein
MGRARHVLDDHSGLPRKVFAQVVGDNLRGNRETAALRSDKNRDGLPFVEIRLSPNRRDCKPEPEQNHNDTQGPLIFHYDLLKPKDSSDHCCFIDSETLLSTREPNFPEALQGYSIFDNRGESQAMPQDRIPSADSSAPQNCPCWGLCAANPALRG